MTIHMLRLTLLLGVAIAPFFSLSFSLPVYAQPSESDNAIPAAQSDLPRFSSPDAPVVTQAVTNAPISREQAPLPLQTVYQTSIEQFEPPFADVSTDHWAYEATTRLFYSGIISGYAQ